ncbi:MAG: zinc metallopeptidase [Candidatus Cloacimonetes bacterium]|nr:zinc metallopeptidase [Candidatus Cloacimonadota bacterium]
MFWGDTTIVLLIPVMILAFWAQSKVKGNYKKFNKIANQAGITGAEAAELILQRNGITDVVIQEVGGVLTDHYHPTKKVVNLSSEVYWSKSISAVSIAAHEVGHAMQHAMGYAPMNIRASIVPVANISSKGAFPLFLIGFFLNTPLLMDLGIWLFAGALMFHLITLPVEFNASKRAFIQLDNGILLDNVEMRGAKSVLNAAALTYVASTLMALVQLIRLIVLRGSRD